MAGLIYGSLDRPPSALQRLRIDAAKRFDSFGLGHWSFPYDLSYLKRFDVLLVIYQQSNDNELVRFIERARRELPDCILVTCSSPPFGRLRAHWKDHPETADRYRAFLDASHFNMNVCRATVPWYRAFSDTPSLYLPQPYPVEYAIQHVERVVGPPAGDDSDSGGRLRSERAGWVPKAPERASSRSEESSLGILSGRSEAERRTGGRPAVYVAGDTVRPDIMTGHLIARALQRKYPDLLIRVTKTPEFSLNTSFLHGARYEVSPFLPWREQLRALANVRLVINTDLWWTRGRVPVDCAAAGVPCVGTTSDGQSELWPALTAADSVHTNTLLSLADRALTDDAFRAVAIATARRRLQHYAYGPTVQRFTHAVELARAGLLQDWRDPVWRGDALVFPEDA